MKRKPPVPWTVGRHRHLTECFGRGRESVRAACPCPPACKKLCKRTTVTLDNAPRVERGTAKKRPYVPLPNAVLGRWTHDGSEPPDSVKLTYAFLVSQTRPEQRWIVKPAAQLADERGITLKAFREHCKRLADLGMVRRILLRKVTQRRCGNERVLFLFDLPEWFVGHIAESVPAAHRHSTEDEPDDGNSDDGDEDDGDWDDSDDDTPPHRGRRGSGDDDAPPRAKGRGGDDSDDEDLDAKEAGARLVEEELERISVRRAASRPVPRTASSAERRRKR